MAQPLHVALDPTLPNPLENALPGGGLRRTRGALLWFARSFSLPAAWVGGAVMGLVAVAGLASALPATGSNAIRELRVESRADATVLTLSGAVGSAYTVLEPVD